MYPVAFIFDLIVIGVLIACFFIYSRKGLLAGIVSFVGSLVAIITALVAARQLSPAVFNNFFRANIEAKTATAIAEQSAVNLEQLLSGILPDFIVEPIVKTFGQTVDFGSSQVAYQIVDQVIAPLVVPIISILVFFIVFAILRVVLGFLGAFLSGANKIPVLGGVNRTLGGVIGILIGCLYVFIFANAVWAMNMIYGADSPLTVFSQSSITFKILSPLNIFTN